MLENIKLISKNALSALSALSALDSSAAQAEEIENLQKIYQQLLTFIEHAENQHATLGLIILSQQLNQTSAGESLDAVKLIQNFSKVLSYPRQTTFSMNKQPREETALDVLKLLTMFPLICVVISLSVMPALLISPISWLCLIASTLPLLAVYAFADEPLSMSRLYQEMAGIEKALAYCNLSMGTLMLIVLMSPEIPLLVTMMALNGLIIVGLSLLQHSKHLQTKHEALSNSARNVESAISNLLPSVHSFFNQADQNPQAYQPNETYQALKNITV